MGNLNQEPSPGTWADLWEPPSLCCLWQRGRAAGPAPPAPSPTAGSLTPNHRLVHRCSVKAPAGQRSLEVLSERGCLAASQNCDKEPSYEGRVGRQGNYTNCMSH